MNRAEQESDWGYLDQEFDSIEDFDFVKKIFRKLPALVSLEPIGGHIVYRPYRGGGYDRTIYRLAEGQWDHEHCSLTFETIHDGDTYYANADEVMVLCEKVYEHYKEEIERRKNT